MNARWLQGPKYFWVDNSDISGPLLRELLPKTFIMEDSTHMIRRGHAHIETWARFEQ